MSLVHLHRVRSFELDHALAQFPPPLRPDGRAVRVLELGAGTGHQAAMLRDRGYDVVAVDVPASAYAAARIFPVIDYDGAALPLPEDSVDVVFSSNVLEHVVDVEGVLAETRRVLRPGGLAVHLVPTPTWRFWTTIAHPLWVAKRLFQRLSGTAAGDGGGAAHDHQDPTGTPASRWRLLLPSRHGERGNTVTEMHYFAARWWRREFREAGFEVIAEHDSGLFYTGAMVLGEAMGTRWRRALARPLGAACRVFVLSARPGDR